MRSFKRGTCLLVAAFALSARAGSPISLAVRVDTAVDRALGCGLAKPMAAELESRLGARIDPKAALVVAVRPGLELVVARGAETVLRRTLKRADCAEVALSAALVVERYLASVSWSGSTQMPAKVTPPTPDIPLPARVAVPLPAPPPPVVPSSPLRPSDAGPPPLVEPAPAASDSSPDAGSPIPAVETPPPPPAVVAVPEPPAPVPPTEAAPVEPTARWFALSVGPAAGFDTGGAPFPSLVVEAAARWRAWRASVLGQGQLPLHYPVEILGRPRGQLTVQPWWALGGLGLCRDGAITGCAEVGAGVLYASGAATGSLNAQRPSSALVPAAAALGRLSYGWVWGAEVGLLAIIAIPLKSQRLDVEGTTAAYSTPVAAGTVVLLFGFGF